MTFLFALVWTLLVAFLLCRAVRQFQAFQLLTPDDAEKGIRLPSLSVVVPARNESGNIARCAGGLTNQEYPGELRVTVVDDDSTDETAAIARRCFCGGAGFSVIPAGTLPPGWIGKSHACWQGARQTGGDWLCFLDADIRPAPHLLRTAVAWAESHGVDMLSLEPEQELGTFWEKVVLMAGMFMMAFFTVDLRAVNTPEEEDVAANGQFILIRRKAYEAVGGHAAVKGEISEDLELARRVKAARFRTFLMGTRDLVRVRMYQDLGEIWEGLSKNAINHLDSRSRAALTAVFAFLFAWASLLIPMAAAAAWLVSSGTVETVAAVLAAAASLALFLTHIAGARYFRIRPAYGLLFPLGYTLVAAIVLNSIRVYREGSIRWKGRMYAPPDEGASPVPDRDPAREGESN